MEEFKVGDWVREDFGDTNVVQIKEKYITNNGDIYINNINSELFSKWQPKEGEWCWFYTSKEHNVCIGVFGGMFGDEFIALNTCSQKYSFKFCEPFIAELPTFLKDR